MKRRLQMVVFVEYVDDQKDSAAADSGAALRQNSAALETFIREKLDEAAPRNVSRTKIRAHVTSANIQGVE